MTSLPGAAEAGVDIAKLRDYLLNAAHPQNGGKCRFFEGFGFRRELAEILQSALRDHVVVNVVASEATSRHGSK